MMEDSKPLVSVIMPCYNDGCYLEETVESLRQQTYKHIELIIIDDGSDDAKTLQVLERIDFPALRVIHARHGYPAAARNLGVAQARGKYLLPLDADDKIAPDYIQKAMDVLEREPEVGVVYSRADFFGDVEDSWELPDFDVHHMLIDNIVFVSSLMRRSVFDSVGGFDESMVHGIEDYDFFLSVIEKGWKFHRLPEVMFHYRVKSGSRSMQFASSQAIYRSTYRMLYTKHRELYHEHMDELFPLLREKYLSARQYKIAQAENIMLHDLLYGKGLKGLIRLLYYRYRRRK